ncbi:hypothetical protein BC834DRAFT_342370 [Gloeopeniophorella convolvens]|nr:hypothetical protein BC834DRAFT_342370 [Gloeopeniophorella convolvens]
MNTPSSISMLKKKSSISRLGSALKSLVVQVAIDAGRAGLAYESVAFTDSQWSDTKGWQVHKAEMYSSSSGSSDLEEPQEIVRGRDYSLELPVEILQHILLLCAESSMADLTNCQDRGPEWIGITRVCRRWRTAALAHHRLWARITPNLTKKWAHVLLKRSDPAPISVHLNLGQVGDSEDGQWTCRDALGILKDSARLRELSLTGSRYYLQYIIDALLYPTKLDTLALSAKDGSLRFPPLVFGGAAPLLRRLTYASGSHFRTPTWMLGNITDFATPGSFPLPELLDALRHMPLLQTLRITRSHQTWSAPDTPAAAPAPVPLDHLSLLSVTDHALPRFFALRAALVLPPSTRTHLRVVTSGSRAGSPGRTSSCASSRCSRPQAACAGSRCPARRTRARSARAVPPTVPTRQAACASNCAGRGALRWTRAAAPCTRQIARSTISRGSACALPPRRTRRISRSPPEMGSPSAAGCPCCASCPRLRRSRYAAADRQARCARWRADARIRPPRVHSCASCGSSARASQTPRRYVRFCAEGHRAQARGRSRSGSWSYSRGASWRRPRWPSCAPSAAAQRSLWYCRSRRSAADGRGGTILLWLYLIYSDSGQRANTSYRRPFLNVVVAPSAVWACDLYITPGEYLHASSLYVCVHESPSRV